VCRRPGPSARPMRVLKWSSGPRCMLGLGFRGVCRFAVWRPYSLGGGELTLKVGQKLQVSTWRQGSCRRQWWRSLTGRGACGEYVGNQASAHGGVFHDVPSSMLKHLGHGAIVEVTHTTAR
jgi:hypothetical protein